MFINKNGTKIGKIRSYFVNIRISAAAVFEKRAAERERRVKREMRKRERGVLFYLNDGEYKKFEEKVARAKTTKSAFLRAAISGKEIIEAPPADYYQLLRAMRGAGNNLNQILARYRGTGFFDEHELKRAAEKLSDATDAVTETFGGRKK